MGGITMAEHKKIEFSVPDVDTAKLQLCYEKPSIDIPDMSKYIQSSLCIAPSITQNLQPVLDQLASLPAKMIETAQYIQPALDALQVLDDIISQIVNTVSFFAASDTKKAELLENYRQWGRYGWTMHPSAAPNIFYTKPDNSNVAHKKMQAFLSKTYSDRLFSLLRKDLNKTSDLESAILCYNNRQYKACALLLFSMIDSEIIHFQTNVQRSDVGTRAIKYVKQKAEEYDESAFIFVLHYANIIACLETLFESGHNFVKEPATINRNYICHGMARRSVRKRDCYQLFLLLYNFQRYSKRWV